VDFIETLNPRKLSGGLHRNPKTLEKLFFWKNAHLPANPKSLKKKKAKP
jgi:hypothetical protein